MIVDPRDRADHLDHGGNRRLIAKAAGLPEEEILDYSANINPLGPPPWLGEAVAQGLARINVYPDPEATMAREAAAARFSAPPERFLFADGADSLLFAMPRALGADVCVLTSPTYSGYRRAARHAGCRQVVLPLIPGEDFRMDSPRFLDSLTKALDGTSDAKEPRCPERAIVFLGAPNNPAGGALPKATIEAFAQAYPRHFFIIDESFLELSRNGESLIGTDAPNIVIARSLTKAWAVPGARVGFIYAAPAVRTAIRAEISAWPVSSFAEVIAAKALGDTAFLAGCLSALLAEEERFSAALAALPRLKIFRSGANFLLADLTDDARGNHIAAALLEHGIAVRRFSPDEGLSGRYLRLAVRSRGENDRFLAALGAIIASEPSL
ncbi:MAG: histidinol-phosphate transaminase [Spirochaetales bacterium]|jgi:histidinol-phosphate/aromatic aminotransferase/cobyric acid decarboxylase-like protein